MVRGDKATSGTGRHCAFVILAHQRPRQVLRLIDRLGDVPTFLHVDNAARHEVFDALAWGAERRDRVHLLPRKRTGWAGWGIPEATLNGLNAAYAHGARHAVVLSGQDYPLVPPGAIQAFSGRNPDTSFMASWELPTPMWGRRGGLERIRYWHQPIRGHRFRIPIPRRLPRGITPYGGSAWSMLSRRAIEDVQRFSARRPDVVRFYRHTWIPDEMFIHTALLNSHTEGHIVNENLWFMDWDDDVKHPRVLRTGDSEALLEAAGDESEVGGPARAKLFARKFDAAADSEVLDVLDEHALDP
jgi:hypothetical protein